MSSDPLTYRANFSDGFILLDKSALARVRAKSNKSPSHAWRGKIVRADGSPFEGSGFACSEKNARSALGRFRLMVKPRKLIFSEITTAEVVA